MLYAQSRPSVTEEAVERIMEMIRSGTYTVGDRLPSERQLAKELQVGRTSVREAIRQLETMGLLESRHGLGTFVKDPSGEMIAVSLVPHLLGDAATVAKLFEVREIIEVEAAGRAAQRATAAQIAAMRKWIETIETRIARGDVEGTVIADLELHRQIINATGNDILVRLMDSIADLLRDMRYDAASVPELLAESVRGHRAILNAIEAGDSGAARQAMKEHLAGIASRGSRFWAGKSRGPDGDES